MQRGATGAVRSTITVVLGALLGIRSIWNSIGVQADKAYWVNNAHGDKFTKGGWGS